MQQQGILRVQQLVNSALALLATRGNDFAQRVERVKNEIWPEILDAVNSCPELSNKERGWLKYRIYKRLDSIQLQGGKPVPIDVTQEVNNIRTNPQAGEAPRVTTPPNLQPIP